MAFVSLYSSSWKLGATRGPHDDDNDALGTKQLMNCQLDSRRSVSSCLLLLLALCVGSVESEEMGPCRDPPESCARTRCSFSLAVFAWFALRKLRKQMHVSVLIFLLRRLKQSLDVFASCYYMGFSRLAASSTFFHFLYDSVDEVMVVVE